MRTPSLLIPLFLASAPLLAQPTQPTQPKTAQPKAFVPADRIHYHIETVVEKVQIPWTILFTPDGRMLFTERQGRIRLYENGKLQEAPYFTVPEVKTAMGGECGLM